LFEKFCRVANCGFDARSDVADLRNGFVDYCRLIAAFGIVWFHTEAPGYRIAYAGLPFFLVLLALPSRMSVPDRARRLLLPFLIWSVVYGLLRVWNSAVEGQALLGWWMPWMALAGPSIHLWFLPFAFLVALVAPFLRASTLLPLLPVLAAGLLSWLGETSAWPWYQWSFGVIPVLAGFAFLQSRTLSVFSLAAAYVVLELFRPSPDNLVIIGGSLLGLVAMSVTMRRSPLSDWCARMSIWVYLGHVMAVSQLRGAGFDGYWLAVLSCLWALVLAICIDLVVQRRAGGSTPTPA
jgi:surface polysaccharide O-acyltransferase-like enzyme